jgi:hypothetical protein
MSCARVGFSQFLKAKIYKRVFIVKKVGQSPKPVLAHLRTKVLNINLPFERGQSYEPSNLILNKTNLF